jgi:hypothetical protein
VEEIGDIFQQKTKYIRKHMSGHLVDVTSRPDLYKQYPPDKERIALPFFEPPGRFVLVDLIKKRRSVRKFAGKPVSKGMLSYLLWSCTGIVCHEHGYQFRAVPSAGALYPIETYLVVNNVEELPEGIYHYGIRGHELEVLEKGSFGKAVYRASLD